eukprot:354169-Chlamydomonas_euryale.AAC.2
MHTELSPGYMRIPREVKVWPCGSVAVYGCGRARVRPCEAAPRRTPKGPCRQCTSACTCIDTTTHACVHGHTNTCMCAWAHQHMHVCMDTPTHACVHGHTNTCVHTFGPIRKRSAQSPHHAGTLRSAAPHRCPLPVNPPSRLCRMAQEIKSHLQEDNLNLRLEKMCARVVSSIDEKQPRVLVAAQKTRRARGPLLAPLQP